MHVCSVCACVLAAGRVLGWWPKAGWGVGGQVATKDELLSLGMWEIPRR